MTDRLRISFRPTKLFLVCAFVLYFCPANISGSYFIPKELVGTWFRPDDPSIPGHLVVTTNSVGGRSLALQPWQYLKLTWDINVFSGPGETKECMKCYRLEVLHRNVIRMHVNEEECLNVTPKINSNNYI